MAAVDEIAIKLGIKTGELKSALKDAGADIKKFKKEGESTEDEGFLGQLKGIKHSMKQFKEVLVAGGLIEAVKRFFAVAIEAAEKSTDATDTSAAAVREFAKGLEEVKHAGASFAVTTVGAFNKLGAAIGDTINIAKSFLQNGLQGFEVWARTADLVAATGKAAEEAERRLAEVRKKNGAEFLAITKELADIEKKSAEQKLKGLDVYETESNLLHKLSELRGKLANFDGDAIEKRRLILELAKTQLSADEATLNVKKAQVDVEKKFGDEREKEVQRIIKLNDELEKKDADEARRRALSGKEELEMFLLQQKRADQLTAAERTRLEVLKLQAKQKGVLVEIDDLIEKKITKGLTPAEKDRLAELVKQADALQVQIDKKTVITVVTEGPQLTAEEAITAELERQAAIVAKTAAKKKTEAEALVAFYNTSLSQKGDVRNLSNEQLDALKQKLQKQLDDVAREDKKIQGPGTIVGFYTSLEQNLFKQNLDAVKAEINARLQFQKTQGFLGGTFNERNYAPDDFARLTQLFNPDQQKKDSQNLATLAIGFQALVPDKFSGAIR